MHGCRGCSAASCSLRLGEATRGSAPPELDGAFERFFSLEFTSKARRTTRLLFLPRRFVRGTRLESRSISKTYKISLRVSTNLASYGGQACQSGD